MKHSSFFIFLWLLVFNCIGQIAIKGTVDEAYIGKTIELLRIADFVTNTEEQLAASKIDDNGHFAISFYMEETSPVYLRIRDVNGYLYAENGNTYNVHFPKWEKDDYYTPKDQKVVQLQWKSKNKLNENIIAFNQDYDEFLRENYRLIVQKNGSAQADTFITEMKQKYLQSDNNFFQNFVNYSLATLSIAAKHNPGKAYKAYINNKPILYHNDAYMELFNQFYQGSFKVMADNKEILEAINEEKDLEKLKKGLQKEDYINGDQLTELFIIKGVLENRFNEDVFEINALKTLLRELEKKSAFPEIRKIAGNAHTIINRLRVGNQAPEFELLDKKDKTAKLSDFKGKYVYLDFWATWCNPCIREMKVISSLAEKYGKGVEFISISIDKEKSKMDNFLKRNKDYDWTFLHFATQPEILEQYNIKGVPMYYLINPEGVIIQSPAYRPSSDKIVPTLEKALKDIETYKSKN